MNELENLVLSNKPISDVILNTEDVMNHFEKIFPEVAKSNEIGRLPMDAFAKWENNKNNIEIKLDSSLSNTTVLTLSILSDNYHITRDVVT